MDTSSRGRRITRPLRLRSRQSGFSIMAIFVSFVLSIILGYLVLTMLESSFGADAFAVDVQQWAEQQRDAEAPLPPPYTATFLIVLLVLGALVDIATGWVAGKMGKESPMLHALVVGILALVITASLQPQGTENLFPSWFNMVGLLATAPLMLVGAWLAAPPE